MNLHTLSWFNEFFVSLVKRGKNLKEVQKLKKIKHWKEYRPTVDGILHGWLNPLMDKAGVSFKIKGKEKVPVDEPVIFTPNHSGAFDIPAIILTAPKVPIFMAKKEFKKIPLLNEWMDAVDCVFVDRNNKDSARSSLHEAIEAVKDGRSLVVFPEGTRSKTGELGKFRGGAMKIAMETGAKIVPVLIEGARERLEKTGNITSGIVSVTYLDPIVTKGLKKEEFFQMPEKIRALIQKERDAQNVY